MPSCSPSAANAAWRVIVTRCAAAAPCVVAVRCAIVAATVRVVATTTAMTLAVLTFSAAAAEPGGSPASSFNAANATATDARPGPNTGGAERAIATARDRYNGDLVDVRRYAGRDQVSVPGLNRGSPPAHDGGPSSVVWEVRLLWPDARADDAQLLRIRVTGDGRFVSAEGHDLVRASRRPR